MRRIVNWVKREYGDVPIYITENGLSDRTGTVEDHRRVNFYKLYINELMKGYADRNSLFFCRKILFAEITIDFMVFDFYDSYFLSLKKRNFVLGVFTKADAKMVISVRQKQFLPLQWCK